MEGSPGGGGGAGGERLRFKDFEFQRLASGRCRAKVVLSWADGRQFTGESDGVISQAGELRCCAEATERALERVVQPKRSEEHTSELQSHSDLVCRLLLEKKKSLYVCILL